MEHKNTDKNSNRIWLILGLIMLCISAVLFVVNGTSSYCRIGPAMCGNMRAAAWIGVALGLMGVGYSIFSHSGKINKPNNNINAGQKMIQAGKVLAGLGLIVAAWAFLKVSTVEGPGGMMFVGIMILFATCFVAGLVLLIAGALMQKQGKDGATKEYHPVLISLYIVGIVFMLMLLFF